MHATKLHCISACGRHPIKLHLFVISKRNIVGGKQLPSMLTKAYIWCGDNLASLTSIYGILVGWDIVGINF